MNTTLIIVFLLLATAIMTSGTTFIPQLSFAATGDRTKRIAEAIANAEGYYVAGSLPQRLNNPGALKIGGGGLTAFASANEGWQALYRQIDLMFSGSSSYYNSSMSIRQIAMIYTGNDNPESWAYNVASCLGVTPDTQLRAV